MKFTGLQVRTVDGRIWTVKQMYLDIPGGYPDTLGAIKVVLVDADGHEVIEYLTALRRAP